MTNLVADNDLKSPYRKLKINGKSQDEHRFCMEQLLGRQLRRNEVVHHINGNKLDNRIENLMVMDMSEHSRLHNQKYGDYKTCVICSKPYQVNPLHRLRQQVCSRECAIELVAKAKRTRVVQYTTNGDYLKTWDSVSEAAQSLGKNHHNISTCLNGRIKSAYGYKWRYADERD